MLSRHQLLNATMEQEATVANTKLDSGQWFHISSHNEGQRRRQGRRQQRKRNGNSFSKLNQFLPLIVPKAKSHFSRLQQLILSDVHENLKTTKTFHGITLEEPEASFSKDVHWGTHTHSHTHIHTHTLPPQRVIQWNDLLLGEIK